MVAMTHSNMQHVRDANRQRGHHFFEPATMRFFNSRIGQTLYSGRYFVTSEQFNSRSPRLYTIREVKPDGSIDTVGKFQDYVTNAQAIAAIKRLLTS